MPVLMRCLLFVSFLLVLGGCKKTPTETSASYVMGKKTEVKQSTHHADQGSKRYTKRKIAQQEKEWIHSLRGIYGG